MVERRGLASAASAVVFSVLLISNSAIFVSSQNRARLYAQSDAMDSLVDEALVLAGSGSVNLLDRVQNSLGSTLFECSTVTDQVTSIVRGLQDIQKAGYLSSSVVADVAPDSFQPDNLTMLAPFEGSFGSNLDIALHTLVTGDDQAMGVSYGKSETHFVHLPLNLDLAVSLCRSAVGAIQESVTASPQPKCATADVGRLLDKEGNSLAAYASLEGFKMSLRYAVIGGSGCTVDYTVSVEKDGIRGPLGPFSLLMQEEALASFHVTSPPPLA